MKNYYIKALTHNMAVIQLSFLLTLKVEYVPKNTIFTCE